MFFGRSNKCLALCPETNGVDEIERELKRKKMYREKAPVFNQRTLIMLDLLAAVRTLWAVWIKGKKSSVAWPKVFLSTSSTMLMLIHPKRTHYSNIAWREGSLINWKRTPLFWIMRHLLVFCQVPQGLLARIVVLLGLQIFTRKENVS